MRVSFLFKGVLVAFWSLFSLQTYANNSCHDLLDFSATKLRSSEQINFCEQFQNKALLVVNTASQCGFTPQFKSLEKIHQRYGDKLAIVGFPSDDFKQEHDDNKKVAEVCYINYGVTFTMLEPSSVTGENANALFQKLKTKTGQSPEWNFNKYLVSVDGGSVEYFPSNVEPESDKMVNAIENVISD